MMIFWLTCLVGYPRTSAPEPKFMGQLLHWITQRPDLSQYQENLRHINVYINPDLKGFSAASFSDKKVIKMIEKGEEAGKKAMKDLLKINKKIQKQHK